GAAALAALRPGEVVRQFYPVLLGSLPLVLTAGLALGVVLWMHLHGTLARFGGPEAVSYLPTALALAVVLEFAPIGAGLIVAAHDARLRRGDRHGRVRRRPARRGRHRGRRAGRHARRRLLHPRRHVGQRAPRPPHPGAGGTPRQLRPVSLEALSGPA